MENFKPGLVLTRNIGERVFLETDDLTIIIELADIRGQQARIRFVAPKSVNIRREELPKRSDQKNDKT